MAESTLLKSLIDNDSDFLQNFNKNNTNITLANDKVINNYQQQQIENNNYILNNIKQQEQQEQIITTATIETLPFEYDQYINNDNIFKTFMFNTFQYLKDYLSSSTTDYDNNVIDDYDEQYSSNESVNKLLTKNNNNNNKDYFNSSLSSNVYVNNIKSDEISIFNFNSTTITTVSSITNQNSNIDEKNFSIENSTSIYLNSKEIVATVTTTPSSATMLSHHTHNHIIIGDNNDHNNHQSLSSTMTPVQKLFDINKMIRTSHGVRPNYDSTTSATASAATTIDAIIPDQNNSIINKYDDFSHINKTLFSTIASNITENHQKPNFFQTSTISPLTTPSINDIFMNDDIDDNNILSYFGGAQCFHSPEDYELLTSMLCSSLLVLGVVYFTYGYRCFRAFNFFVGFIFGAILFHTICTAENLSILSSIIPQYGNLISSILAGTLIGIFTMLVAYLGLFIIGIHLGLMLAIALLIVIYILRPYYLPLQAPLSSLTLLIFFIALSLVGSLTTVYFSKGGTIMASSMYGSALTLLCIDYFVEDFKVIHWFFDQLSSSTTTTNNSLINNNFGLAITNDYSNSNDINDNIITFDINNNSNNINQNDWYGLLSGIKRSQTLCPLSLIIFILWPILTLIGIIIQTFCTARNYKYHNGYGMVDNNSGRITPPISNHSRESFRSLNHYHYPYPNVSTKLYQHNMKNDDRFNNKNNNDRSSKNSLANLEEQRLEQRHRKYRYLYQVRTAHGDVISQRYLQSLQNKKQNHQHQQQQQHQQLCLPDQDSFTFNSDLSSHIFPSESRTTTLSVA